MVKLTFRHTLNQLKLVANKFDEASNDSKIIFLDTLSTKTLPLNATLIEYTHVILFICAHPSQPEVLIIAEEELNRVARVLRSTPEKNKKTFENSGLPYTRSLTTFSHDFLDWLIKIDDVKVSIDSFHKSKIPLPESISFTLLSLEKEYAGMSHHAKGIFDLLQVDRKNHLSFLLCEFSKLNDQHFIKDYFFNALQVYVLIQPTTKEFSKAFNRIAHRSHYFHHDILKQFDQLELLNRKLPSPKSLNKTEFNATVKVIRNSLALLQRETDPVTYMQHDSFRLYELERGISIAIYGMSPERQLPLESYVGYTLFKNGYPAAYGGAWVFGKRSLFGINIFEPYRGGESGYMMCQLLRVYRQAFSVDYFEVEPYQYGAGNPEGISSGAYWFYYRFGFRSLEPELSALAESEFEKIKHTKGYRSDESTLIRFTESNVALQLGKTIPLTIAEVRDRVTHYIAQQHKGNRAEAEKQVIKNVMSQLKGKKSFTKEEKKVLSETAFLCEVLGIHSTSKLKAVEGLIVSKPKDLYTYQQLLLQVLA